MLKIGHRGACGYAPENTLVSFEKALALKVDMVECDVYLTKDNIPVVIHDPTVNRTTDGKGEVEKMFLDEIKKLNISPNEKIPTLEEVINLVKGKCLLNTEIKDIQAGNAVADLLIKNGLHESSLVSSKYQGILKELKSLGKQIKTGWVFWPAKTELRQFLFDALLLPFLPLLQKYIFCKLIEAKIDTLILHHPFITHSFIKKLKKHDIKVFAWTVNKPKTIQKMKKLELDGVVSNYPDRI